MIVEPWSHKRVHFHHNYAQLTKIFRPSIKPGTSHNWSISSTNTWLVNQEVVTTDYDAILVLGGGLTSDGDIPPWVTRRLDAAAHIYSIQQANSFGEQPPILLLGAGTPHKKTVLDGNGFTLHESTAYANYLMEKGYVTASDILKETSSYDTVGNAYFGLTMHALPACWRRLSIVTSEFHMQRTKATFDYVFSLANQAIALEYCPVSDDGLFAEEVINARAQKEASAVQVWNLNMTTITTLKQFHSWLFANHLCYSVSRQHEFGREKNLDPRLAATY